MGDGAHARACAGRVADASTGVTSARAYGRDSHGHGRSRLLVVVAMTVARRRWNQP